MRQEHAHFIDNADDEQLKRVRADLESLLTTLREPEVRQDTKVLLKAIDQEMLERVMRRHRSEQGQAGRRRAAKAA